MVRFRYNNNIGGREDIEYADQLNPAGFLSSYFNGIHFIELDKKRSAYDCMNSCLDHNPEFVPAKVEHARLEWTLNNKIREAFDEFIEVIEMEMSSVIWCMDIIMDQNGAWIVSSFQLPLLYI